jgi:16S rRNA (guanine1516-N2)-methyltransferase
MKFAEFLLAVSAEHDSLNSKAIVLAQSLQLPFVPQDSLDYLYLLIVTSEKLLLKSTQRKNTNAIYVDFLSAKLRYRQKNPQRELLKKAMGMPSGFVVDATAGLGEDAFILATKGYNVLMIERSPILAKLLEDGLERYHTALSPTNSAFKNGSLRFIHRNAIDYLPILAQTTTIDVVYLDPMFPDRKKAALPRKEMEFLRELIGKDSDASKLLEIALKVARRRVVVKQPRLAPALGNLAPSFSLIGKACRFDVYHRKRLFFPIES